MLAEKKKGKLRRQLIHKEALFNFHIIVTSITGFALTLFQKKIISVKMNAFLYQTCSNTIIHHKHRKRNTMLVMNYFVFILFKYSQILFISNEEKRSFTMYRYIRIIV